MARIDLRSDTVTKPSSAMRRAMAEAEVGDDVFGDDPTVNALEERAAELLGKEAGLFVASGTMGNLVAQMAHLSRGQETIAGREHHLVIDEAAGHAVIVGSSIRSLEDRPDGTVDPAEIEAAFRDPNDPHEPITGLVTIENTHAHSMGQPLDAAYTRAVADIAAFQHAPLHEFGMAVAQIVVDDRREALLEEIEARVGPDIARASGHENISHVQELRNAMTRLISSRPIIDGSLKCTLSHAFQRPASRTDCRGA